MYDNINVILIQIIYKLLLVFVWPLNFNTFRKKEALPENKFLFSFFKQRDGTFQ